MWVDSREVLTPWTVSDLGLYLLPGTCVLLIEEFEYRLLASIDVLLRSETTPPRHVSHRTIVWTSYRSRRDYRSSVGSAPNSRASHSGQ
jgi:hypothetical protein